jgi:Abortive infection alpha
MPKSSKTKKKLDVAKTSSKGRLSDKALGPAAQQFGQEVAPLGKELGALTVRVGNSLTRALEPLVYGLEKSAGWIEKEVTQRLRNVPENKIVSPEPRIAVPALQALTYSVDTEFIRDMFANLLAADMNLDIKGDVHPAFVEIIKEMTPVDAKVLAVVRHENREVEFTVRVGRSQEFLTLATRYSFEIEGLDTSECERSLSNLQRLGLIDAREEFPVFEKHSQTEKALIEEFEPAKKELVTRSNAPEGTMAIFVRRRGLYPTPLGKSFIRVCLTA